MLGLSPGRGKRRNFEKELKGVLDALYNMAFQLTRDRDDAEDLVQDASLRAYRNFHRFKEGTNFKAWIMTVLRNIYINEYRKKAREPEKLEYREDETEKYSSAPDAETGFGEKTGEIIAGMPDEMRSVLTLFYSEGFSYREIAQIMNIPEGTVMSRLHGARRRLKKQLGKPGGKKDEAGLRGNRG